MKELLDMIRFSSLPTDEQWCLYHPKQIERQEKQNEYYEKI
jgi:hypothetical protein